MAIVATFLVVSPASAAATVTVGSVLKTDGTAPFDGVAAAGNDTGANNGVVRTFDFATYAVTIGNSGLGNNINNTTVTATLPVGMVWNALDGTCLTSAVTPVSSISTDRRTITCNIGSRLAGSLVELPLVAYPLGTVPNGTTKTVDFTIAYNDPGSSNARITQAGGSVELAVSAGKNPDLSHNDNVAPVSGTQYIADTTSAATSSTIAGFVTDGGTPVAGTTVALVDTNNNPVLIPGTSTPFSATTDGAGSYSFTGVPTGVVRTKITAGAPAGKVPVGPMSYLNTVQGQSFTNNFDYATPAVGTGTATISGTLFHDSNLNGVNNAEPAIDRVTLTLTGYGHDGTPVSRTVDTAANGSYSFSVPPSGPNGYKITASGRKVVKYLAVVTNEYNVHVGDAQTKTVDIAWSTDVNRGKNFVTRFPIALKAPASGKGVASLSGPITWTENVPAGATVASCGRVGQNGTQFYYLPGGTGGGLNNVVNSGTWTCSQAGGPGTPVTVTVNGADTSGTTFPTRNQYSQVLPADARYLAVGYVAIAQPDPGCGVSIGTRTVSSSGFSATDVGGNTMGDAYSQTDTLTAAALPSGRDCTPLPGQSGIQGYDKHFTKDESHGWAAPANEDYWSTSNLHNTGGNSHVPASAPFGSQIYTYNASDVWDSTNINVCDKFDVTRFGLINRIGVSPATPFAITVTNPQSPYANRLLRQYTSTAAFDAASATSGAFIVEFGVGTPYASLAAQRSATCNESITWYAWDPATPVDQAVLDGAIVYRVRSKAFQPGDAIRVRAAMIAKSTPGGTYAGVGLNPVPNPDPTLANTIGAYTSFGDGSSYAQPNYQTRFADPGNGIVRINKYDSAASSGTTLTSAVSGNTVGQTIYVTANGVYPDSGLTMGNVTVVDTLPAGLAYVAGSAAPAPTSVVPGAGGTTVVTWELGNLSTDTGSATITYQASVSPDVSTGSTITNTAVVSSTDDPSPVGLRTDSHQLAITANAEFKIFKVTPDPKVEPEDTFRYRLGYKNLSATALTSQDFIDVLPYSGDGRTTGYDGVYTLDPNTADPIVPDNASDDIYVTTAAPATITRDPRAAVNTLPSTGAVTWCLVPDDLGGAGCPTDIHDPAITALRVTSTTSMSLAAPTRYIDVYLRPTGDAVGNKFGNNFSATGAGLGTYVQSNAPVVDVARGTVSNLVWHDLNANGRQDGGEPGISGVQVTLTGKDYAWDGDSYEIRNDYDASPLTTTTNGSGLYSFSDLNHGTFKVNFPLTTSGGLSLTKQDNATDIVDSDADPATGDTAEFCLGEAPDTSGTGTCPDYTGLEANQTQWDAGYTGSGYVGDLVWADTNGDGQKQGGESGLSGWDVDLIGPGPDGLIDTTDDVVVGNSPTDSSGIYGFGGLEPGPYRVQITPANGWQATRKDSGSDSSDSDVDPATNRIAVNAASGVTNNTYDAGYYRPTGFGDRVWVDDDADGIQDPGEADLEGVRVDLLDNSSNPVTNTLGQPIFTTTDANGYYEFTNLRSGTYKARFTKPFGYSITTQRPSGGTDGAGAADDSDPDRNGVATVTLESGDPFLADVDAGMFKPVTIGDKVWADTDRDGTQDPGEPGVSGVTVALFDQSGSAVLNTSGAAYTTTTDSAGRYTFTDLFPKPASNPSDYYRVRFTLPAGYKWTGSGPITAPDQTSVPTTGSDTTDSDTTWTTRTQSTTFSGNLYLSQSETNETVDAGIYRPARVGNLVWRDDDADGIQDATETGQTGVTVSLLQRTGSGDDGLADTSDDVFEPALDDDGGTVATVTTNSSGSYSFTNLSTGVYRVRYEWTGGAHLAPTVADASGNAIDDVDSDAVATATTRRAETGPVLLTYGDIDNNVDAGFTPTSAIGDKVWEDLDGDGTQDAGEPGVDGAEVTLWTSGTDATFGTGDDVQVLVDANNADYGTAGTLTTDSTGAYTFDDLAPGTYQVRVITPGASWRPTLVANPGSPALANDDSDLGTLGGDGRTAVTAPVTLAPLDRVLKIDAGLYRVSSIGDRVFADTDGDGIQDLGESGSPGADLTLWTAGTDATFGTGDDVQETTDADGTTFGSSGVLTTGSDGSYTFSNLRPGTYQVRVTAPTTNVITRTDAGSDDTEDSDAVRVSPTAGRLPARTIASNTDATDLDTGVFVPVAVGDLIWVDADGDGTQNNGETGLAGATVTLLDGSADPITTNALDNAVSAQTTAADGAYSFGDLAPGTYQVQVDLPAGYLHTEVGAGSDAELDSDIDPSTHRSAALNLDSGASYSSLDAGAYRGVSVGNRVWEDTDANGIQDAGETTGIPGVTVELVRGSNTVVASTATDASGNYGFSRIGSNQADSGAALLPPGTYKVRFHRPTGWAPSRSTGTDLSVADDSDVVFAAFDDATADTSAVAIAENTNEVDIDAGFFRPGSIGDRIWEDLNGDGDQDTGEPGLAGVVVTLVDQYGDPVTNVGGDDLTDITTGSDGAYAFEGLRPGRYRVVATFDDTVWVVTGRDLGGDNAKDSDIGVDGVGELLTVVSGTDVTDNDGGLYHTIALGDLVFEDRDGDGIQDSGEPGVASVPVVLDGTDGLGTTVHLTTVTNFAGAYEFRNLAPGTYHVTVLPLSGWTATVRDQGADDTLDSDIDPTTLRTDDTVLTSYEIDRSWDAGLVHAPLVSGHVYVDSDNDGVRDPGEAGRSAVTVTLTGTDSVGDPVARTTTTDATGTYVFTGIPTSDNAGYTVTESQPAGLLDGRDTVGTAGGTASANDVISGIVVASGTLGENYDFGELTPSSITGIVYVDATGNGIVDAGEPRLASVTLDLTGIDDLGANVTASTTTGSDGTFSFTTLRPGAYTVTETQPAGYGDGPERAGNSGGSISVDDTISTILLAPGTSATGYLFGERSSAPVGYTTLEGTVWRDPNRDGVHNAGETGGVAGVTITLERPDGSVAATTVTDVNGHYAFTGFATGDYVVRQTQPAGWKSTSPDAIGSTSSPIRVPAAGLRNQDFFEDRGRIAGVVFSDDDNDGARDAGETGISGARLTLSGTDVDGNAVSRSATTSADGSYRFVDLVASDSSGYTVTEAQPAGWTDGTDATGSVDGSPVGTLGNDVLSAIVLPVGGDGTAYTFGEIRPAGGAGTTFVSGHVYLDADRDGSLDPGESGLAGVTVQLLDGSSAVVSTQVTGLDGNYAFTGIAPGSYRVREIQPAGYTSTTPDELGPLTVPITGLTNQDFGERLPGSGSGAAWVGGHVFADRDGDGTIDTGEPGIADVTVTLLDAFGTTIGLLTTDADGSYRFENLAPGSYVLVETQPTGLASSTTDTIDPVVVPLDGLDGQDFGETLGSIRGSVFVDLDNDGVRDAGEVGIAGATVTLTGTDAASNAVLQTTISDLDGRWTVGDLIAGTYTVTETQPALHADGLDHAGTAGGTVTNDAISAIVLPAGGLLTAYDFGETDRTILTPAGTSWITGVVFHDRDRDSVIDGGETPLAGVMVELRDGTNALVGTTLTGPAGSYTFTGLTPGGTYTVTETDPTGYGSSLHPGATAVTAPAADTGGPGPDFGDTLAELAGTVFVDVDRDGVRDAGEPGIVGATVTLDGTDATGSAVTATTATATDGSYRFGDLLAGTYRITETQPWGHLDGAEVQGSIPSDTSVNDVHGAVLVGAGVVGTGLDFGEHRAPSITTAISGRVFHDRGADGTTANGTYETGEPGLGGVTLILRDVNDVVVDSTVTASNGTYAFTGVPSGTYSVEKLQPAGYGISTPSLLGSLNVPIVGLDDVDFGVTLGSLRGVVFSDVDDDGRLDSGESGIAGVALLVTGTDAFGNAVSEPATTDANGRFAVVDLLGSDPTGYTVTEAQPTGWVDGVDVSALTGVSGEDQFPGIVVAAGESLDVGTFGEIAGVRLGDTVWNDADGDGVQDASEDGVGGMLVRLTGTTTRTGLPAVELSTTTAADGTYAFADLRPGTYRVAVTLGDRIVSYRGVGGDRTVDSDVDDDGRADAVTVVGNETVATHESDRLDLDAGVSKGGSIRGRLFKDGNRSGTRNAGEAAGSCAEVRLTPAGPDRVFDSADDPKVVSTKPTNDGSYEFGPVLPGRYRIGSDCTTTVEVEVLGEQIVNDVDLPMEVAPSMLAFSGATVAWVLSFSVLLAGAGIVVLSVRPGIVRRRKQHPTT